MFSALLRYSIACYYECLNIYRNLIVLHLDLIQVVITPVSTEVNVTFPVLPIVKPARVTYKVERVSCVNLDGLIDIVIKVRPQKVKDAYIGRLCLCYQSNKFDATHFQCYQAIHCLPLLRIIIKIVQYPTIIHWIST